ncbi:hypothetical protein BN970_01388 [Mycolicibacterium conceptionense]|uniref:Uncharacterized protein n=1 Tax=Mycolicibacterium conceptionense TaxID=451644 RepID=A0A0U1D6H7_9MYCO|nr:hypothetical protein BN970_01388 [Mycolicibacterium conceptionense]
MALEVEEVAVEIRSVEEDQIPSEGDDSNSGDSAGTEGKKYSRHWCCSSQIFFIAVC